jgi:hypothetical protein
MRARACTQAFTWLRAVARPFRFRVIPDGEGFPLIPGRYGQIEWHDGRDLAVYTDHPRLFAKLRAIPSLRPHQTGDFELRALFPVPALAAVARVIRAKRWGGSGRGRPENLRRGPGHSGPSASPEGPSGPPPIPDLGSGTDAPGTGGVSGPERPPALPGAAPSDPGPPAPPPTSRARERASRSRRAAVGPMRPRHRPPRTSPRLPRPAQGPGP